MNPPSRTELDAFETALLAELRSQVEQNAAETSPLEAAQHPPRRSRRWVAGIAASATVAVGATILMHSLQPTPAYAVSGRNGKEVTVRVMRLEGAAELERALAERGIPADITYLPAGKQCARNRYTAVSGPGLMLGVGQNMFEVTIPAGAVGKGDTFVMSASVVPIENRVTASVEFDIAHGPVKPCRVVDAS